MANLKLKEAATSPGFGEILPFVGMVMPYAGTTEPTGWKFCNGQDLLIANYPLLYAVIYDPGYIWTSPPATGYFRLPSLIGSFLVGTTTQVSVGTSPVSPTHTHSVAYGSTNSVNADTAHNHTGNNTGVATTANTGWAYSVDFHSHNCSISGFSYSGSNTVGQGNGNAQANVLSNTHGHSTGWFFVGGSGSATQNHSHGNTYTSGGASVTTHAHTVGSTSTATASVESLPKNIINLNYIIKAG
jgi:microcystin-dependent protein